MKKEVSLATPRGFCAGVEHAIELLSAPIHVRNEVVHNKFVVNGLIDHASEIKKEWLENADNVGVTAGAQ